MSALLPLVGLFALFLVVGVAGLAHERRAASARGASHSHGYRLRHHRD